MYTMLILKWITKTNETIPTELYVNVQSSTLSQIIAKKNVTAKHNVKLFKLEKQQLLGYENNQQKTNMTYNN